MSKGMEAAISRRKASKPVMEKKRRARINQSLDELKTLILEATMKKDISCNSKLEKADILEMTVRYLKNLRSHQITNNSQRDPLANYRAGFNECAGEITRYLATIDGVGISWKTTLLEHLAACCHSSAAGSSVLKTPLAVPCLPSMHKSLNPQPTSPALSWLQRKQEEAPSKCEHSTQLRLFSAGSFNNARLAAILVPSGTSPLLGTTPELSRKQDLIPVLCKGPIETSSCTTSGSLGAQSKLWRPF